MLVKSSLTQLLCENTANTNSTYTSLHIVRQQLYISSQPNSQPHKPGHRCCGRDQPESCCIDHPQPSSINPAQSPGSRPFSVTLTPQSSEAIFVQTSKLLFAILKGLLLNTMTLESICSLFLLSHAWRRDGYIFGVFRMHGLEVRRGAGCRQTNRPGFVLAVCFYSPHGVVCEECLEKSVCMSDLCVCVYGHWNIW